MSISLVGCEAKVSIAVKDHDFVGEDKPLMAELARRMSATVLNITLPDYSEEAELEPVYLNKSIRIPTELETRKRYYGAYRQEPTDEHAKALTMKLMEQACYSVQYRLKDIDHIVRKYADDPRYRLAFIFKQLDDWEFDIRVLFAFVSNWKRMHSWKFRVYRNIYYYTHCVRKMVDVTYTVEYVLVLQQEIEILFPVDKDAPAEDAKLPGANA